MPAKANPNDLLQWMMHDSTVWFGSGSLLCPPKGLKKDVWLKQPWYWLLLVSEIMNVNIIKQVHKTIDMMLAKQQVNILRVSWLVATPLYVIGLCAMK